MSGTVLPALRVTEPKGAVTAVALVLHGGRSTSRARVRPNQLAVLRMVPFAKALERGGADCGLAVARLRYVLRGWNGADQSPVPDTQWALDQLAARFPGVPIALVGHSMGGRTAMYTAGHPGVRAVVGLAPWIEPGDPVDQLAGRRVLIAHGDEDRMTDPRASAAFARAAASVAESVSYVTVSADKHAMLRRARVWHRLASEFVLAVLCGKQPHSDDPSDDAVDRTVSEALAGEPALVV